METMAKQERICVLGLGYIGLPSAVLLACAGHEVLGVDVIPSIVDAVNSGVLCTTEPELARYFNEAHRSGRLRAAAAPGPAELFLIAVPTPCLADHRPDLSCVTAAVRSIAPCVRPGNAVILESTSPVGTTEMVSAILRKAGVDTEEIDIAYCPERVLPGRIMYELIHNDRLVGGTSRKATRRIAALYRSFVQGKVLETESRTAEMAKLAENSYRDVQIAFANELSIVCGRFGIDVHDLISLANHHPRVHILQPGIGVGGHCVAVDPWFLVSMAPEETTLVRAGRERNLSKTRWVTAEILRRIAEDTERLGRSPRIACMGLAYKADVGDLRESPAVEIVRSLQERGCDVVAVEPHVRAVEGIRLAPADRAVEESDLIAYLVPHTLFRGLEVPRGKTLDFCGALER